MAENEMMDMEEPSILKKDGSPYRRIDEDASYRPEPVYRI